MRERFLARVIRASARLVVLMKVRNLALFILCGLMLAPAASFVAAQQDNDNPETVAPAMSERQRQRQEQQLRRELERPFRRWLDEDVAYIITGEERTAFSYNFV